MNAPAPRLHALDNLRAVMMWLGIVLHVAAMHTVAPSPLFWRDNARSQVADLLTAFIHAFRMPVFFIVAGFFVALLMHQRGPAAMLRHRFRRIALPFLVFWLPLLVATMLAVLLHLHVAAHGRPGLDETLLPPLPDRPRLNTLHLWFIYLLWWFAVATALGAAAWRRLPAAWRGRLPRALVSLPQALVRLGERWWGLPLLVAPLVAAGVWYPHGVVVPAGSLLPPWQEWLHNGLFFAAGLVLYAGRERLLPLYQRRAGTLAGAGALAFAATLVVAGLQRRGVALPAGAAWSALVYNTCTWLWSAAALGLFLRWLPARSPALGYLADSSYWVYLVHMPLTVAFGALLFTLPLGAGAKMLANIVLTTLVCLLSYQAFVRGRWIGRLLNGPGRETLARPAAATAAA